MITQLVRDDVTSWLKALDSLAGFWTKWGLTTGLLILGLGSAAVAVIAKIEGVHGWDDASLAASLGFGFLTLALAVLARIESNRRTDRRELLGVRLTELEVGKQLELHATVSDVIHRAVSEAVATLREKPPTPPGGVGD